MPADIKDHIPPQVGPYQLAEEIGRGSVAVVYRATDTLYDRAVAIKVLHPYFAHYLAFVRHFIAEGREAARLRHPNILQVFDAGQADGVAYIAQELVTGGTLADMVQARGGPFTLDEAVAVVGQVAAGLDYAHQQGVLHRNLKPSNIFFAEQGRVQIADFSAGGAVPTNYPLGSPAYLSPEQARGDTSIDGRSDIYSLGVIAFLMLTGRLPFAADNPLVLLRKISDDMPPLLERLIPGIDPGIAQVTSQVLAKKPSARYVTATAFANALGRGGPVAARIGPLPVVSAAGEATRTFEQPTLIPQELPAAKAPPAKPELAQRTVMVLAMTGVTVLLLLAIMAFRFAPLLFERVIGRDEPVKNEVAVIRVVAATPATSTATPTAVAGQEQAVSAAVANVGQASGVAVAAMTASTVAPPPTVNLLPTLVSTFTPLPTSTPTATPSSTPTPLPTETSSPTPTETAATQSNIPAAPVDAPTGRIAYTIQNPRTDRMDVIIYDLAANASGPILPNQRQPDFNNQSDLAVNGEGGNMDNLLLMRLPGEQLAIISAFAEDAHPHWAPSNKMIVFDSTLVGDGRRRLYLQHDTNYHQAVGPLMYDAWEIFGQYPIFLLDERIAYNGCDVWENASTCGIFVVDTRGSKPVNLTQWPRDIPTDNLGYRALFMSDRAGDWNVYLADPASGAVQQLTFDTSGDGLATASPDGNHIAFLTDREGVWSIYVMRPDGSDQRKLFDLAGSYGWGDRDWIHERISWGR